MYIKLAAALLCVSLLSGCALMLNRDYMIVSSHLEQRGDGGTDNVKTVENYTALKNVILLLVQSGDTEGVIHMTNYSGDVSRDLPKACLDVTKESPLGAYAVDYIWYKDARMLSYYEVKLSISYRRTLQQIEEIVPVSSPRSFYEEVEKCLAGFSQRLVVQTPYYIESDYDVKKVLSEVYYTVPDAAFGMPKVTVTVYPDSGWRRIIEVELEYSDNISLLRGKSLALDKRAREIFIEYKAPASPKTYSTALFLFNALSSFARVAEPKDAVAEEPALPADEMSAYGALIKGRATDEGFALAYKKLCDIAGIECIVVDGRYENNAHKWNIIRLDGRYYHVDPALGSAEYRNMTQAGASDQKPYYEFFLLSDKEISLTHKWNMSNYPSCEESSEYREMAASALEDGSVDQNRG